LHLFGLTGGIASGKSAAAARLRARGVPVIDADQLAREVLLPGTDGLAEVVAEFGAGVLDPTGALDRKAVASAVFGDEAKRRRLNAITHPRITRLTVERSRELADRGEPLACYEAALIVENRVEDLFRPLVVVSAPEAVQLERMRARDGLTEEEARRRLAAQKPLAEKVKAADFVIDTTGPIEDLQGKVDEVLRKICDRVGVDPARYLPPRD
jgi:dephospho-CoA kinase